MKAIGVLAPLLVLVLVLALAAGPAAASPNVRYGIQDDAWLAYGPGTLEDRLGELDRLGVDIVRFNLRWDEIARRKPAAPRRPGDPAYAWGAGDAVLRGLRAHGIDAVVGLVATPRWANGGRASNWAPTSSRTFGDFAYAAALRYRWVRKWLVWNEPNQRRWLRPTSPGVYVTRLLNPAYTAIHKANPLARVGGGVTAPRGDSGGVSPVDWIRGMRAAHARLDAYAHHPYPLDPRRDTPFKGGCDHCTTITMPRLERLLREVRLSFGAKRIWLTEFGYQTNPPDRYLGVSDALQARYIGEAALRAARAPAVDMLIQFLYRDEAEVGRWQSGLETASGVPKPSMRAFALPLAEVARRGSRTTVWGQVRPRSGSQPYRLEVRNGSRRRWLAPARTNGRGGFQQTIDAARGALVRIWSPRDREFSPALRVV